MELQLAFFGDDAQETLDGKLTVQGIFHDLFAPGFPAMQERMVLVLVMDWDRKDQGRYNLKAELVAPDGSVVLTVDGHSDVQTQPPDRPPARTRLVMELKKAVFPQIGRYHLRVIVKGKRFRGPSLHLVPMEGSEEEGTSVG
jgi:hypothetical protein